MLEDLRLLKEKKKEEKLLEQQELKVDVGKEREYKNSIYQKVVEEQKDQIQFKQLNMKESQRAKKEDYAKKMIEEQELREKEREKEIQIQMKDL
mmetsp:Transcript_19550/g.14259  ORF Transcript_19550/g.14259 Transcript_19550/m.14259 type:complete len:94 (-) Transcript_19550:124-405(-)